MKKNYIIISILGTLWGLLETHVGTFLHVVDVPFVGLIMMAFGIFFQTAARRITRMKGSALLVAIVAAFLKLLFIGGIAASTVIAIFIQSLVLEVVYWSSSPGRIRMSSAGAFAVCYALFHPFLSMPILMGLTMLDAWHRIVAGGSVLFHLPKESGLSIIFILFVVHALTGFLVSWFSFAFAAKLVSRGLFSSSVIEKQ